MSVHFPAAGDRLHRGRLRPPGRPLPTAADTGNRQIRSLVLRVDLVGSKRIWAAQVRCPVDPDGSRRSLLDRLDDQADDQVPSRRQDHEGCGRYQRRRCMTSANGGRPGGWIGVSGGRRRDLRVPLASRGEGEGMNLALSIFDLFAYAIPGSLYLAILVYISQRLGWVNLAPAASLNATALVGVTLASYLLGHITYQLGRFVDGVLPWRKGMPDVRQEFVTRVPTSKARFLVQADPFLLLAAAEVEAKEAAIEISRLRAGGIMLRNSVPALTLAFAVCVTEFVAGTNQLFTACASFVFLFAAFAALRHGRELAEWAISKTLQVAYWTTEVDDLTDTREPA
jgi:hypothetical protein